MYDIYCANVMECFSSLHFTVWYILCQCYGVFFLTSFHSMIYTVPMLWNVFSYSISQHDLYGVNVMGCFFSLNFTAWFIWCQCYHLWRDHGICLQRPERCKSCVSASFSSGLCFFVRNKWPGALLFSLDRWSNTGWSTFLTNSWRAATISCQLLGFFVFAVFK